MNATLNSLQMTSPDRPNGWYRSKEGMFLGICKGLADWKDIPVFWIRLTLILITVVVFNIALPIAVLIYMAMAFFIPKAPEKTHVIKNHDTIVPSASRVSSMLDSLERRTQRVEDAVVNRETDWDRRFHDK